MRAKRLTKRFNGQRLHTALALLLALGVSFAPYHPVPSTPPHAAQNAITRVTTQAQATTQVSTQGAHVHHIAPGLRAGTSEPPTPHHDPRGNAHCVLCIVGAGLLALSVAVTFRAARGFVHFYKPRLHAPPDIFTLYRSRAPPRFLVTDRTAFKKSFIS